MKGIKKIIVTALVAPALAFAPGCSGDKGAAKDVTVGKPPRVDDNKTPRDSTQDDPDAARRVTPERLKPDSTDEDAGGETPEG
jgi:hypothetical protein